jgi:hypothetical protein
LLLRGAALWCCVLLHVCCELLRRSMQHCGVEVVADAE